MRISLAFFTGVLPAFAAMALIAGPLAAQEEQSEQNNCVCFGDATGEHVFAPAFGGQRRAQIGVYLGESAGVDGHTGVEVTDVMADGPAADAGLEAGDIITAINGAELGDSPADALLDAMADVEPGATVTLTYYRDGSARTASIVTQEATGLRILRNLGPGGNLGVRILPRMDLDRVRERTGEFNWVTPRAFISELSFGGLDLVAVNPGLGEYFGTDEGVLVADIDQDSSLGLQPGDVILAIGDREVRDPAHARSILHSYRGDEEVSFRIVRRQRTLEVTGTTGR